MFSIADFHTCSFLLLFHLGSQAQERASEERGWEIRKEKTGMKGNNLGWAICNHSSQLVQDVFTPSCKVACTFNIIHISGK